MQQAMTATPAAKAARRPVTLEEKRARQRAYVKKSYYRQQVRVSLSLSLYGSLYVTLVY